MNINIGKRKTAKAKVEIKIVPNNGKILINNNNINMYFFNELNIINYILEPLFFIKNIQNLNINIFIKGGGISSQKDAIRLGIAKAISKINIFLKKKINQFSYLKSDSRIKERRKYGLKKARKASQYSKR